MSNKKKSQSREDFKQEDILQAVVLADSFNVRFAPVSDRRPKALMPLANIPLLAYTLEFLSTAGIQQIIVYCCAHADQIKQYLLKSKWLSDSSTVDVRIILSEDCLSPGDAIRDLDGKSLIKSDFVLVNGDLVSNMKLKELMEAHKVRRLADKSPIMTLVLKPAEPGHRTRCREEELVVAFQPDKQRVLHFQKVHNKKKFNFPLELFQAHSEVDIRYDLLDCSLCICSPQVPQLFTDNFDYLTRDDFIKGILENEEIFGNTIHYHILEEDYCSRASNLIMYDALSKDVINRWCFPIVPDNPISDTSEERYSYGRHNIYLHKDVTLARHKCLVMSFSTNLGCVLKENVMIGKGSSIGSDTFIQDSIIGKNCTIGENVHLEGAYLWDNVTIEDNCRVTSCLLADDVHILRGTTLMPGCVLADKVKVGPDVTLPANTVLTASAEELVGAEIEPSLVGSEGVAYVYESEEESDDEETELVKDMWGLKIESDDAESSDDDRSMQGSPPPDDSKMFYKELLGTMERALEENIGKDNMVLEINSLKAAYFMQIKEVNHLFTKALLEFPVRDGKSLDSSQYVTALKKILSRFLPVLKNYIRNDESQRDCISSIEETCLTSDVITSGLQTILHLLYNSDVIEEDVILTWHEKVPPGTDEEDDRNALRNKVSGFIKWLQDAEEESSEESD